VEKVEIAVLAANLLNSKDQRREKVKSNGSALGVTLLRCDFTMNTARAETESPTRAAVQLQLGGYDAS